MSNLNSTKLKETIETFFVSKYPDLEKKELYKTNSMKSLLNLDSIGLVTVIIELEALLNHRFLTAEIYNFDISFEEFLEIIKKELL